jgi:anthranilate phosphoribosyltransferase
VCGEKVSEQQWHPEDFGLAPCTLKELHAQGPEDSAAIIRGVLAVEDGPATRVVLANAAAALLAADRVASLREGVASAAEAVSSGRAARVLAKLVALSRADPA